MKQPVAKFITVYNQEDEFDDKGKNILVSPRNTPNFDLFVDEVNDKLAPPGVALRKIYTAQGGSKVRSVSALTISKEYTASPKRFNKNKSRAGSKKNSAASSEGYHSDDENKRKKGNGRLTLMERQAMYAKPRSLSEPSSPRDSSPKRKISPAWKPITKPKPKQSRAKKESITKNQNKTIAQKSPKKKPMTFNQRGKARLDKTYKKQYESDSDDERGKHLLERKESLLEDSTFSSRTMKRKVTMIVTLQERQRGHLQGKIPL